MADLRQEQARILFFSQTANTVVGEQVFSGTATEVAIPLKAVAARAFDLQAPAILLAHNHPSGDPRPSKQDIEFTRRMHSVFNALEIRVYDHIIISCTGSFSFREAGYM